MGEINRSGDFTRVEAIRIIKEKGKIQLAYDEDWDDRGHILYLLEIIGANVADVILPEFRGFEHSHCEIRMSSEPDILHNIRYMKHAVRVIKKEIRSIKELKRVKVEISQYYDREIL